MLDCEIINFTVFVLLAAEVLVYYVAIYITIGALRTEDPQSFEKYGSPKLSLRGAFEGSVSAIKIVLLHTVSTTRDHRIFLGLWIARGTLVIACLTILMGISTLVEACT